MNPVDVTRGEPGPSAKFWNFLREGKFMLQRSASTGKYVFFPRIRIPGSGETDLEWVEASGKGTVYATTVVPRKPERGGDYSIVLVDLDEGVRMMSRVAGMDPWKVEIGMKVTAKIEVIPEDEGKEDPQPLVVFYAE